MYDIVKIRSLSQPGLEVYAHLNENQLRHYYEPEIGVFIAESPNVILRALRAGYEPLSVLMEEKYLPTEGAEILKDLERREEKIPVYVSTLEVLSAITGYHLTRGILSALRRKALSPAEEVCRGARRIVVLDNVENPTNVGAIIRSAAALGMDGVLLTPTCADPLYRRAVRVSVGTVFQIPWTYIGVSERHYTWMRKREPDRDTSHGMHRCLNNGETVSDDFNQVSDNGMECGPGSVIPWPDQGIEQLHGLGFRTAALALDDRAIRIDDPILAAEPRLALIMGNEGEGLSEQTIAACDYVVRIPMSHGVDSLNVAAASAVAFWQLREREE